MHFHHQWSFLAPQTLSNPRQTVTSSIDKSRHGKNAWVSIDLAIIGHLTFTVRRSLAQTWHLWIDCSADGNIRLTRRNVNKMQPALARSDATRYTKLPSSDRMVNQPTPQTRSSCSQGSRFLRLKIHSTEWSFPNEVLANENLLFSPILVLPWLYWAESIETPHPSIRDVTIHRCITIFCATIHVSYRQHNIASREPSRRPLISLEWRQRTSLVNVFNIRCH